MPRNERPFAKIVKSRAKLSLIITINEIAEFSWAKEIRAVK
jgi:hypothetical protein